MISFLYYFHYVRFQPKIFLPLFGISISIEEILITETIEYRWYKSKYLEGVSTSKDSTSRSSTSRFKALFPIYFLNGSRDSKYSGCKKSERKPYFSTKIPILRVGAWSMLVDPAYSTLDQPTLYTSSLTHSKMSYFQRVLLKIQQFAFLIGQFCFILY